MVPLNFQQRITYCSLSSTHHCHH